LAKDSTKNTRALDIYRDQYQKKSRDNARTPVQWSSAPNAGFTSPNVKPWMSVNPNHKTINAEAQVSDPSSPYSYWRAVLNIRKKYMDIFVYGDFVMLDRYSEEVWAYTRQYDDQQALVLCNWTDKTVMWDPAANDIGAVKDVVLNSYGVREKYSGEKWPLRPYEATVLLVSPSN
jgi:glycosidase